MSAQDDLATLRRRVTNYASVAQDYEGLAALSRVESRLAHLEEGLLEDVKEAIKELVRLDTHAAESQHSQSIRRARQEEKAIALQVRLALAAAVRRVESGQ